ncbi:MAG: tetratricopeptide repeat protein [Bacteroidales bacterium]|nr:tetratricopeptide repeat protein [Bacteroidales bacterium]
MKRLFAAVSALFLGAALAMAQDFNAAVDTFNSINSAESKLEKLEIARSALAQFQACEEEEAPAMVEKCKAIIPDILVSLGKECINDKKYDDALAYVREAIALAKEYGLSAEGSDSVEAKALKLIPDALMRKGTTLIKANDFAGAVAVLKEALEYDAENGKIWLFLAQSLIKTGADEDAVEALKSAAEFGQAQKANGLLYKEYIKLGDAKKKERGGLNDAIAFYEKALEIEENAQVVLKIANTHLQGNANAKAISFFKRYLELSPEAENANDVIYTIAATAQKSGDISTALHYYNMLKNDAKYGATAAQMIQQLNK